MLAALQIASLCPFRAGTLVWENQPGQRSLTICVKGTFAIVPGGEATIASDQEEPTTDRHLETNPLASLYCPSDFAPLKRRVDVSFVGSAHAPAGPPVASLIARIGVGDFSKSIRVCGDSRWVAGSSGLVATPPQPFMRMPIRYERAPAGPDNPVGIDAGGPRAAGALAAPNIEATDASGTAGLGPIAPTWRPRRRILDDAALFWAYGVASGKASAGPAPPKLDFAFFNSAPRDQQIEMLRGGAKLELVHLNPQHAKLVTTLPSIRPQAFVVHARGGRSEEIILRCDSLWIECDRMLFTLTWRGIAELPADETAIDKLVVVADEHGKKLRYDLIERMMADDAPSHVDDAEDPLAVRYDSVKSSRGGDDSGFLPAPEVDAIAKKSRPPDDPTQRFDVATPTKEIVAPNKRAVLPFVPAAPGKPTLLSSPPPPPVEKKRDAFDSDSTQAVDTEAAGRPVTPFASERAREEAKAVEAEILAEATSDLGEARYYEKSRPTIANEETASEVYSFDATPPPMIGPIDPPKKSEPAPKPASEPPPPSAPPTVDEPAPPAEPGHLSLTTYAAILAEINTKGDRAKVLTDREMTEADWTRADKHWSRSIAEDTERGDRDRLHEFDAAYVAAQEKLKRPIGVPEYARILVGVERGEVGKVLAELELQLTDLMRLQRVWTKRVADTPQLAGELNKAVEAARRVKG